MGRENLKTEWWKDEIKAVGESKVATWRICREQRMKVRKKEVWKFIKRKREGLRGAYMKN